MKTREESNMENDEELSEKCSSTQHTTMTKTNLESRGFLCIHAYKGHNCSKLLVFIMNENLANITYYRLGILY